MQAGVGAGDDIWRCYAWIWGELYDRDTGAGTGRVVSAQRADLTRIVDRFGKVVPTQPTRLNAMVYAGSKVTGNAVGGVGDALGTVANLSGRNPTAQWALGRTALIAGMGEGAYQCLHDALAAIPELIQMVYSATMSHARGTLLADATGLIAALTRLTPADIANLVIPGLGDLPSKLVSAELTPIEKYHTFGKVLGYVLAEVAIAIVTTGASLGVRVPTILARFGKVGRVATLRRAANDLAQAASLKRIRDRYQEAIAKQFSVPVSAGKGPKTVGPTKSKTAAGNVAQAQGGAKSHVEDMDNALRPNSSPTTTTTPAPSSPLVRGGGLVAHESAGGHLVDRHVGKTETDLRARLAAQPNIPAASTFVTRTQAETAVSAVLTERSPEVRAWEATGASGRLVLDAPMNTGIVLERGASSAVAGRGVRLVLKSNGSGGWYILTGFPTP